MTTYDATTVAQDTLHNHYRSPGIVLHADDYAPHMRYDNGTGWRRYGIGYTDWSYRHLHEVPDMVCSYTGYTRNQMLAAMLNAELAEAVKADSVRRIDAVLNEVWVYPPSIEEQDRLYAQHQAKRYMC